jgi:hypothetical protein
MILQKMDPSKKGYINYKEFAHHISLMIESTDSWTPKLVVKSLQRNKERKSVSSCMDASNTDANAYHGSGS